MARVTHVKKARPSKDERTCRRCGHKIAVGESFYWFANRMGRISITKYFCGKHPPRPSEMTTSDKLSALYSARETVEDNLAAGFEEVDDVVGWLNEAAETAREVGEQYEESRSNMESSFPNGCPIMEELETKKEACEAWAEELESAANDIDSKEKPEDEDEEDLATWKEEIIEAAQNAVDALEL